MKALLLTDIQNDFLPGGALEVPQGDEILPVVNKLLEKDFDVVVACKDWHPKDHVSFAENHGMKAGELYKGEPLWPVHCVQETWGAAFPDELKQDSIDRVFYKGVDRYVDSYSAFFDNEKVRSTGLDEYLRTRGCETLVVAGLATDYCVLFTVKDGLSLGFNVIVVSDGCAGIELRKGDEEEALQEMKEAGAQVIPSEAL